MSSKREIDDVQILDPPTRAVILGVVSATGMYAVSRQGCGIARRSCTLLGSIVFLVIMNYYLPLHRALVSKDRNIHVYWYITLILVCVILLLTFYHALSDVDTFNMHPRPASSSETGWQLHGAHAHT